MYDVFVAITNIFLHLFQVHNFIITLRYFYLGYLMASQGSQLKEAPIQIITDFKGSDYDYLLQLQDKFYQAHPSFKKCQQVYIIHPDIRILLTYLFFSLAPDSAYSKSTQKIAKKLHKISEQDLDLCKQKFRLAQKGYQFNLVEKITQNNGNKISSNRELLTRVAKQFQINDLKSLVRLGLKQFEGNFVVQMKNKGKSQQFYKTEDPKAYIILLKIQQGKSALIFYQKYSSPQQQEISMKKEQKQNTSGNLRKSKSEGHQEINLKSPAPLEDNGVTWFQALLIVILIAAILASYQGAFDPFLKEYNKKIGKYYLLDFGYRLIGLCTGLKDKYFAQL